MADEIKQELGFDASQAIQTLATLDGSLGRFEQRLKTTSSALGVFNKNPKKIDAAFKSSMDSAVKDVNRLRTSLELLSRIVFTQFIVRALSTLRNSLKATARDAIEFQNALALITTIDDSNTGFSRLSENVRSISEDFNIPLLETAAGLYQTISNQIGDAAQSQEFLSKTAQFAKATNSSLANSVDLLSGALKSFQLDVSETDRVASVFFKVIDLGRIEANELANSFGRVAPVAADLGISLEETGAALASISVRGSKASEALTQVRAITTGLIKPSEAMQKVLRDLGFTSAESAIRTLGFAGVLSELEKSTGGSSEALAKLFPNVRGLSGVSALAGDDLKSLSNGIKEMTEVSADFSKQKFLQATNTDAERLTKQINILKNAFTVDLGQSLLKSGVELSDWVGGAENVIDISKSAGPAIFGVAGAFGIARAQALAARLEFTATAKALGALALVPAAIGLGSSLGSLIDEQLNDNSLINNLEKFNAGQLKALQSGLKERRDELNKADNDRIKETFKTFQILNQAYLSDVDNAQSANDALVANTESSLSKILGTRERLVDELARASARADTILQNSQSRVLGLTDRQEDQEFNQRTSSLSDSQKAIELGRRAQSIANSASKQLNKAGLLGDLDGISRALQQFDKADRLLSDSADISKRIGNRELEARAIRQASSLTDQQLQSEKRLAAVQKQRQVALDRERASQQSVVNQIREQVKIATANTGLFDSSGKQFNEADLAKRSAKRSAALNKVAELSLGQKDLTAAGALGVADFVSRFQNELSRDPLRLAIETKSVTDQIHAALEKSFSTFKLESGVNVAGLEELFGRQLKTPDQVGAALDEAASKAANLRAEIDKALEAGPQADALRTEISTIFDTINSRGTVRGIGAALDPTLKGLTQQLAALGTQFSAVLADPSVGKLQQLIAARNEFGRNALGANFGQQVFGADLQSLDQALTKLQQLSKLKPGNTDQLKQQLQQIDSVLESSNPSDQFRDAAIAIHSSAESSEAVANAWQFAASEAAKVGAVFDKLNGKAATDNKANGGRAFANGGQGVDTIPAMLSPGEFVMNPRASQRFFSQIQAMNAGQRPLFRENGGSTTIGDTHVTVNGSGSPEATARAVMVKIKREQRRGSGRL